jgi:L-glyceraldehyde 3-phosphate reductase
MALAWLYRKEVVSSVLIGASKPEQIIENLKMTENLNFTQEELDEIDRVIL